MLKLKYKPYEGVNIMIHSFLLIGQSNAAGRGFFGEAEPLDICGGRLKVLRNGLWLNMFRPVNPDRSFSGTCLAESFAKEYAIAHQEFDVGIIPCADGGTQISQWMPGEILFDNAVNCAKLAMRTSILKGIIWHQGEGDCSDEKCEKYAERFTIMMTALKDALGCPDIPVMIGGLGDFLANFDPNSTIPRCYSKINAVLESLGESFPNCAFVPANSLTSNPDNLHFSAAALKEFGVRYYKAYETLKKSDNAHSPKTETNERTSLELL